jgi:multidrug efflux pump subunit AcrA (membrane-fusion protein)
MLKRVLISVACAIAILVIGVAANKTLANLKKPPAEAPVEERALRVKAVRVVGEDVPVTITGYGEVRALDVVTITPEVVGKVVEIYPSLEVGSVVPKGETLFVIDPRTYAARVEEARAAVKQIGSGIERLRTQLANDEKRLTTLSRSRDLARAEYERVKRLLEIDQVGAQSGVDAAERAYNGAVDLVDQMDRAIAVYPIQIQELSDSLDSARARMEIAEINLERTRLTAPFDARIVEVHIEKDQYVAPGAPVPLLTLSDDSVLEISVPLDSRDARQWLRFNGSRSADETAWFNDLKRVPCSVIWTEDKNGHAWSGTVDRVEKFDSRSRTLTVAVRIEGADALSDDADRLPLVDGMFCVVEIPGRTLERAYRLPSWAVSFENAVYVDVNGRLRTTPVTVAWAHGDSVFVTDGLTSGDLVVTTRLVNPLEGSLLDITIENEETATI